MPFEAGAHVRSMLRGPLPWALGAVLTTAGYLALGTDARLDSASVALSLTAGVLAWLLHALRGIAMAFTHAEPSDDELASEVGEAVRELHEEQRRVLRAIKELDFDHAMGKIGDGDWQIVREGYQVRAIEVMRKLEQPSALHPLLQRELAERAARVAADPASPAVAAAPVCPGCGEGVDADARFCKHCGRGLTG